MTQTKKKKLIIELATKHPNILKSDIQQGIKYSLKVCKQLNKISPNLALIASQIALNQLLEGLKE